MSEKMFNMSLPNIATVNFFNFLLVTRQPVIYSVIFSIDLIDLLGGNGLII